MIYTLIMNFFCVVSVAWTVQYLLHRFPFGGCANLFRKSLAGSVSMIRTDSNCFCAVVF